MKLKNAVFPSTRWSLLDRTRVDAPQRIEALNDLLARAYWRPLRDYLCAKGHPLEEANDLIQAFFLHVLEKKPFEKAERNRGRFRALLLTTLTNFVRNARRDAHAEKRHPKAGFASLDDEPLRYFYPEILIDRQTPEAHFHAQWVRIVIARVVGALEASAQSAGKAEHFFIFNTWVLMPELEGTVSPPLLELAKRHGLGAKAAANIVVTMKRSFRRLLLAEVSRYTDTTDEVEAEVTDVLNLLHFRPLR